jgi:hypothetical protein
VDQIHIGAGPSGHLQHDHGTIQFNRRTATIVQHAPGFSDQMKGVVQSVVCMILWRNWPELFQHKIALLGLLVSTGQKL